MLKTKQVKLTSKDNADLKLIRKRETALANLNKYNKMPKELRKKTGRKTLAKTLEIYVKQYLNTDESVRHFKKWADQKPGEALPWAWKVVYGDGNGTLGPQKGQVNVLIQILTGRNIPSQPCQGNEQPQAIESQSSDILPVVVTVPVPENPENR